MRRILLAGLAAALIVGVDSCIAAAPPAVQVTGDEFSKEIKFVGPAQALNPFVGTFRIWRLRSWLDRETKVATHQLYAEIAYSGSWRWYTRAADEAATQLEATRIAADVYSCGSFECSYSETVGIELPDALVRSKAETGFRVKLFAKSGSALILEVGAEQVRAQIAAIDGYVGYGGSVPTTPLAPPPQAFGADFSDAGSFTRTMLKLDSAVVVNWVKRDSVAARAGLRIADVIAEWDNLPIQSADELRSKVGRATSGRTVKFTVIRARTPIEMAAEF